MMRILPIVGALLVLIIPFSYAMEKGEYAVPSLNGYTLDHTKQLDKDEIMDGIKETTFERYKNAAGQKILKYTTNGKTWAWGILGNPSNPNDLTNNYVILDSDGDGKFDEKYLGNEDFFLPKLLKGQEK